MYRPLALLLAVVALLGGGARAAQAEPHNPLGGQPVSAYPALEQLCEARGGSIVSQFIDGPACLGPEVGSHGFAPELMICERIGGEFLRFAEHQGRQSWRCAGLL